VNAETTRAPLASFEAKWSQAYPEFGLAQRFLRGAERDEHTAYACLVFELEHAAFAIREMQPASIKLQWWAEEFARTGRREARHPLTQVLVDRIAAAAIPQARWHETIIGAMEQRDPEPAASGAILLEGYARLYAPVAAIEAALFGTHAEALARALALRRALRESAALPEALRDGKSPLPLDILARHRLARGDLSAASPGRRDALAEWLAMLAGELAMLASGDAARIRPLGVLRAVMTAADAARASKAASAGDPAAAIGPALAGLSLPAVWSAWRAARRSRM
jgi:hypothetical protein